MAANLKGTFLGRTAANGTSVSVTIPDGEVAVGDLLVAIICKDGGGFVGSLSGWSTRSNVNNGTACAKRLFDRLADAGDAAGPNTYIWSGASESWVAFIMVFENTLASIARNGGALNTNAVPTSTGLRSDTNNSIIVHGFMADRAQTPHTLDAALTVIEIDYESKIGGGANEVAMSFGYELINTTVESPGRTHAIDASDEWISFSFVMESSGSPSVSIAGSIASVGNITKNTAKSFAGTIIGAGFFGILPHKVITGNITLAGNTVVSGIKKILAGIITGAGIRTKKVTIGLFSGSITAAGALAAIRKYFQALAGIITSLGIVTTTKHLVHSISGQITVTGSILKQVAITVVGNLTTAGQITVVNIKTFIAGIITPTGKVLRLTKTFLAGTITLSGAFTKLLSIAIFITGSITIASGVLQRKIKSNLSGIISLTGARVKRINTNLIGLITPNSLIRKKMFIFFTGVITTSRNLLNAIKHLRPGEVIRLTLYMQKAIKLVKYVDLSRTVTGFINQIFSQTAIISLSDNITGNITQVLETDVDLRVEISEDDKEIIPFDLQLGIAARTMIRYINKTVFLTSYIDQIIPQAFCLALKNSINRNVHQSFILNPEL